MKQQAFLIAYFSRRGYNYVNGRIENLAVGNTETVVNKIQKLTGGDLFQIEPSVPYPQDYRETTAAARRELQADARPKICGPLPDLFPYRFILLGYPNWCGTMPMPVFTFLESSDCSGKTVLPFCTHEGSGMGGEEALRSLCPGAALKTGLAIRGIQAASADETIKDWLHQSGLI